MANPSQVVSTVLIFFVGGPLADQVNKWTTRRRIGIREPENPLSNLILPIVLILVEAIIQDRCQRQLLHKHLESDAVSFCGPATGQLACVCESALMSVEALRYEMTVVVYRMGQVKSSDDGDRCIHLPSDPHDAAVKGVSLLLSFGDRKH